MEEPPPCVVKSGCDPSQCVVSVEGFRGNNVSPTESWLVTFRDGTVDSAGQPFGAVFLKIWLDLLKSADDLERGSDVRLRYATAKNTIRGLEYEAGVYEKLKPYADRWPHFLKLRWTVKGCPEHGFVEMIRKGVPEANQTAEDAQNILNAVAWDLANDNKKRPPLLARRSDAESDGLWSWKFSAIATEALPRDAMPFKNWSESILVPIQTDHPEKLKETYEPPTQEVQSVFWKLLFQAVVTILLLEEIGLTHGDLHPGNVFVLKLPVFVRLTYKINGQTISFLTDHVVVFFDWDHAQWQTPGTAKPGQKLGINPSFAKHGVHLRDPNKRKDPDAGIPKKLDLYEFLSTLFPVWMHIAIALLQRINPRFTAKVDPKAEDELTWLIRGGEARLWEQHAAYNKVVWDQLPSSTEILFKIADEQQFDRRVDPIEEKQKALPMMKVSCADEAFWKWEPVDVIGPSCDLNRDRFEYYLYGHLDSSGTFRTVEQISIDDDDPNAGSRCKQFLRRLFGNHPDRAFEAAYAQAKADGSLAKNLRTAKDQYNGLLLYFKGNSLGDQIFGIDPSLHATTGAVMGSDVYQAVRGKGDVFRGLSFQEIGNICKHNAAPS